MLSRREVMKRSLLCSLAPAVPAFLARTARAAPSQSDRRVLVVIELDGGNDGLNTVVPFRDENYARLRPKLKLETSRLIKLNDELGLHSAMKAAGELFDAGQLTVVQGVGYPNPNRSHFRSKAIWQSARLDEAEHGQTGWLGRALDARHHAVPDAVYVGSDAPGVALWGRRATVAAIRSLDELTLAAPASLLRAALTSPAAASATAEQVARVCDEAFMTAERLTSLAETPSARTNVGYGGSRLGRDLQAVSALIKSDCRAGVYYTVQPGYDTHAGQLNTHYNLLRDLSTALKAFLSDLETAGLAERVLVLAYGEFGRRAGENQSAGTDHGAAAPVFVAGTSLAGGVIGPNPNLAELEMGDVRMAIDFRQVYATLLDQWLGVPSAEVLGASFDPIPLLNG